MYSFLYKGLLMASADSVFKAIAHPARREIISLLSVSDRSVKELTAEFEISQSAISQHLRELKDAQLVSSERNGLEQKYHLTAAPLKAVLDWSAQYRSLFDPAGHAWAFHSSSEQKNSIPKKRRPNNGR
jgi:DNA-binding transcriptional ArsR family regulator